MGLSCFACFDGGSKQQRREEERLASAEARAKAAEAAQKRVVNFLTGSRTEDVMMIETTEKASWKTKTISSLRNETLSNSNDLGRRTSSKVADELKLKPVLDVAAVLIECFQPCSSFIGFDHMVNFTGFSPSEGTFFARYVFC
ncbi:hypothetical protein OIU78_012003 [Salix suchowensis]|nr:hypothetical protein OIU78_012003 [Salix suchowensis]